MRVAVFDTRPYDREFLTSAGPDVNWRFLDFRLSPDTAPSAGGAQAVCVFVNDRLDRSCLEGVARLGVKLVALRCAGYNNVDLKAAEDLGVTVCRVPAYSPHAVAEHAVALLLTLNRKTHRAYSRVRELNFSLNGLMGFDLHGKTAGIVGTGRIGKITAQILKGFGMRVLATERYPDPDWARAHGIEYTDTRTLAAESDVVSLHVPLTAESRRMVRKDTLDLMKPGSILINVSRGELIDTADLIEALKSGRLGGVGLDVYEEEEGVFFEDLSDQVLQDDVLARLLSFPNVLVTSHQAFFTREALTEIARVTVANITASSAGAPLLPGTALASAGA